MSLAALNQPALVAATGAGALALLPFAERLAAESVLSWTQIKGAAAAAYLVQVVAVSVPGRIDEAVAKAISSEQKGENGTEVPAEGKDLAPVTGRTLVAPSGWAFGVWGPIFLGESVYAVGQLFVPDGDPLVPLLRTVAVPFAFAHVFQSLWCAAFRRRYDGYRRYISFGMLSATAFSLSRAHAAYAAASATYTAGTYARMFLPISLHCGWTVAASLVNLNGAFSMDAAASPKAIAVLGHASAVAAAALGVVVTTTRAAPVFGGVIAWALLAVADGMKQRLDRAEKEDDGDAANLVGAAVQRKFCLGGAAAVGVAMAVATSKILHSHHGRL